MKKYLKVLAAVLVFVILISGGKYVYDMYQEYQAEKRAEEDIIMVACVGDSLTFRRSYDGWPIYNYPSILSEMLGEKYKVTNYGMSGTCVQADLGYPFSSTRAYRASVEAEADILVIMLGSNDIWNTGWRDEETFYMHYTNLIDSYLQTEHTPEIYLCTIPYIYMEENPAFGSGYNDKGEKITSVIRKIADERGYHIIEMRQASIEHPEWYEEDGVHFNMDGANGVAQTVFNEISEVREWGSKDENEK